MAHEYVYWNRDQTADKGCKDEGYTTHNDWSKAGAGNGHADHVCRPVIVDAMGRKRPIVCFTPVSNTGTYVTTIETVLERFRPPPAAAAAAEPKYSHPVGAEEYKHSPPGRMVDEHKCSYPARVEEYKHSSPARVSDEHKYSYPVRVEEYKHSSPARVVDEHKYSYPVMVEEYKHSSPARVVDEHKCSYPVRVEEYKHSSPARVVDEQKYSYPVRVEYKLISPGKEVDELNHSHPVRVVEYRHSSPAKGPVHDRPPPKVQEFITKIHAEVIQLPPARPGPLTALNWRQPRNNPPKPPALAGGCYGEYSDPYRSKDDYWNKPNCPVIIRSESDDHGDDYNRRHDTNAWGGTATATAANGKLTRPTTDIAAAVGILKEAVAPSSGQHVRFVAPVSTGPKYTETIDSKEAAKRYGSFSGSPRPYTTGGMNTIDSKTAEEKYKGAKVK